MSDNKPVKVKDPTLPARIRASILNKGLIGSTVGGSILKSMVGNDLHGNVADELMAVALEDFQPKTAAERMLVEQLVVNHMQVLRAHQRLAMAERYDTIEQSANIASKLQADFRKTLLTLKEWNAPPRPVIHAQQANVANQQIIQQQNETTRNDNAPNGLGAKSA